MPQFDGTYWGHSDLLTVPTYYLTVVGPGYHCEFQFSYLQNWDGNSACGQMWKKERSRSCQRLYLDFFFQSISSQESLKALQREQKEERGVWKRKGSRETWKKKHFSQGTPTPCDCRWGWARSGGSGSRWHSHHILVAPTRAAKPHRRIASNRACTGRRDSRTPRRLRRGPRSGCALQALRREPGRRRGRTMFPSEPAEISGWWATGPHSVCSVLWPQNSIKIPEWGTLRMTDI